jgi:hypothetical protein
MNANERENEREGGIASGSALTAARWIAVGTACGPKTRRDFALFADSFLISKNLSFSSTEEQR